jgi:predicted small secreted protein
MTNEQLAAEVVENYALQNYYDLKVYQGVMNMKDVTLKEKSIYTYIKLTPQINNEKFRGTLVYQSLGIPKITFNLTIQKLIERGWINKIGRGIYSVTQTGIF